MARTHVGEFSLTPSPQSYKLHGERARSSEFHLALPLARNLHGHSRTTIAHLPLQAHSFLTRLRAFAISFSKLECRVQDSSLIVPET